MALSQKLAMRQGQSLVMTPQLSQSIKLLAMSNIELCSFVDDEIERNPFLDKNQPSPDSREEMPPPHPDADGTEEFTATSELETSAQALSENLGTSLENTFPDEQDYAHQKEPSRDRDLERSRVDTGGLQLAANTSIHDSSIADHTACKPTMQDHLAQQLAMSAASEQTALIAHELIAALDEAGYLRADMDTVAERLGTSNPQVSTALALVQSFDPPGIAARDLGECLRLQLAEKARLDPAMEVIIDNIDLLARRDFDSLARLTGLDMEDLHDAMLEIRALDPKPGTAFETQPVEHIVPDVTVSEAADGSWHIELNSDSLPRVLVNNEYVTQVARSTTTETEKTFLSDCLQTANWLTRSLDQRAQTILKVAREIVKQQDAFLVHGIRHLRPLTLKTVADEISMHESSVSRVTNNKYMMTPRGLFELKYFFTASIPATDDGEEHSAEAVRAAIRQVIDAETSGTVLSDDAIVLALKSEGIDIARRTVAKYREAMNIPSSVHRRREKRAADAARQLRDIVNSPVAAH